MKLYRVCLQVGDGVLKRGFWLEWKICAFRYVIFYVFSTKLCVAGGLTGLTWQLAFLAVPELLLAVLAFPVQPL